MDPSVPWTGYCTFRARPKILLVPDIVRQFHRKLGQDYHNTTHIHCLHCVFFFFWIIWILKTVIFIPFCYAEWYFGYYFDIHPPQVYFLNQPLRYVSQPTDHRVACSRLCCMLCAIWTRWDQHIQSGFWWKGKWFIWYEYLFWRHHCFNFLLRHSFWLEFLMMRNWQTARSQKNAIYSTIFLCTPSSLSFFLTENTLISSLNHLYQFWCCIPASLNIPVTMGVGINANWIFFPFSSNWVCWFLIGVVGSPSKLKKCLHSCRISCIHV